MQKKSGNIANRRSKLYCTGRHAAGVMPHTARNTALLWPTEILSPPFYSLTVQQCGKYIAAAHRTMLRSIASIITIRLFISAISISSPCFPTSEGKHMVFRSSAEHDFGGKNAVLMGERTCTAALFRNMADRLEADSASLSL